MNCFAAYVYCLGIGRLVTNDSNFITLRDILESLYIGDSATINYCPPFTEMLSSIFYFLAHLVLY